MAKNNTSTNPTFHGEVTRKSDGKVFTSENHMEHEVRSKLLQMAKTFGYDKSTAVITRYDANIGDYVPDAEATDRIFNPRPNRSAGTPAKQVERATPNEQHFINASKLGDMWLKEARALKKASTRPAIPQDELYQLLQETIEAFVEMGVPAESIITTVETIIEDEESDSAE